jgi:hypothetical protein
MLYGLTFYLIFTVGVGGGGRWLDGAWRGGIFITRDETIFITRDGHDAYRIESLCTGTYRYA